LKIQILKNKKGFAIAFSWLFALMVGIAIFLFLVGFAVKNTDLFGALTSQVAVEKLDIAFSGYTGSLVGNILNFEKDVSLKLDCIPNVGEKLFVNDKGGKTLKGKFVFGPSEMKSFEYSVWTLDWNVPFKVANFIFLAPKGAAIIDLSDLDLDKLKKKVDESGVGDLFDFTQNRDGLDVVWDTNPVNCNSVDKIKIKLNYDVDLKEHYGIICVNKGGSIKEHKFVGDAVVFAAAFSDFEDFSCNFNLAKAKAGIIRNLHENRIGFAAHCDSSLSSWRLGNIEDAVKIKEENDRLLRDNDCKEVIY
jgi:hypothetical protein